LITNNVLYRTIHIGYHGSTATGFTIDVDGKQYLITARHVVEGMPNIDMMQFFVNNEWKENPARIIGVGSDEDDVAVLSLFFQVPSLAPLVPQVDELAIGGDVYFLGYPYAMSGSSGNEHYRFPLVKKGCVSALLCDDDRSVNRILIDAINNEGFSGGPVVYRPISQPEELCVCGVISGYKPYTQEVLQGNYRTGLTYSTNTGITIAYPILRALEIINANPNGFILDQ
jgi:hypothetical protein